MPFIDLWSEISNSLAGGSKSNKQSSPCWKKLNKKNLKTAQAAFPVLTGLKKLYKYNAG